MIKQIVTLATPKISSLNLTALERYAAIDISSSIRYGNLPTYPDVVRPILALSFDDLLPPHDPALRKDFYERCKKSGHVIFDHKMADQIINFLQAIETDGNEITVFVNCSTGISRATAIAKFLYGLKKVSWHSHEVSTLDFANTWIVNLLTQLWIMKSAQMGVKW